MKCEVCGFYSRDGYYFVGSPTFCNECFKKQFPEKQAELLQQATQSRSVSENPSDEPGSEAISVLRVFAWLDLVAGIMGSFWILSTFGSYSVTVPKPIGIAVGIATILQGVFVCAFFLVVASIAENLIAIRKNTAGK